MRAPAAVRVVIAVLLLPASQVGADSLRQAYFAATPPGAWAEYESNWQMADGTSGASVYTYVRAADVDGRVRIEITTRTVAGPGEGVVARQLFVMEPGFDLDREFMDRMRYLEASAAQTNDGPAAAMQGNVIEIMRAAAGDLTNSVTFKGTKEIGGRKCDHYDYSYRSGGPYVTIQEGEICLDQTVPFGVVYQKGESKDEGGALLSSYEQKLVDAGTGRSASDALLAAIPVPAAPEETGPGAPATVSFVDAYQSGRVRLFVEVVEGSGGRRLDISALNQSDEPFDLVVPGGLLSLPAGSPIGDLNLFVDEELHFSLEPGDGSAPFSVGQPGDRGATEGRFQLTVYDGTPLYQGTVEVGPIE